MENTPPSDNVSLGSHMKKFLESGFGKSLDGTQEWPPRLYNHAKKLEVDFAIEAEVAVVIPSPIAS